MEDINRAFDGYWYADLAYPGEALSSKATAEMLPVLRSKYDEKLKSYSARLSSYSKERKNWQSLFVELPGNVEKGRSLYLQDIPVSVDGKEMNLFDMIDQIAGESSEDLIIVSPYFIPTNNWLDEITEMASRGVKVKIITGSLGSNNHTAVTQSLQKISAW